MENDFKYTTIEKVLLSKATAKRLPVNGGIELTPLCNMNCDMCYVRLPKSAVDAKGGLRTFEEWLEIARQMKESGVLFLLLTGGEPLTYPNFKELYLGLLELGMIIAINTNGTLIDEEWARFFGEHKPRRINITLYGKNNETYDSLCHYNGGYDKTIRGIRLLRENNVDVKMNCSIAKNNSEDLEDLIQIAQDLDVPIAIDTFMVAATRERELPYDMQSRMNPSTAAHARIKALKSRLDNSTLLQLREQARLESNAIKEHKCQANLGVTCYAGRCSFMLTWQGIMKPCVIMEGIDADVFEVGFENAWKHIVEETDKLRINQKCATCIHKPLCKNCIATAKAETGEYDGISEYVCDYAKASFDVLDKECEEFES